MDVPLFYAIHAFSSKNALIDWVIIFFATWYVWVLLLILCYFAWRSFQKGGVSSMYPYCVALAGAVIARAGVTELVRYFYHNERPFVALGVSHLVTDDSYSFPSGHTIFIFALGAALYGFNKKLAYFFFASGLLVGFARIAAGVHYPSDIVGGIVLGIFMGGATYFLTKRFLLTK